MNGPFARTRRTKAPATRSSAPKLSVLTGSVEIGGPPGRLNGPFNRVNGAIGGAGR
jgi:hypothetical protein